MLGPSVTVPSGLIEVPAVFGLHLLGVQAVNLCTELLTKDPVCPQFTLCHRAAFLIVLNRVSVCLP